jgi:hypothetical protein
VPSPFYELSKRFGLHRLLGTSNVHDIGTGFQSLGADIDNINHGHQDFLQAGVVSESDWSFATATLTINGGGEIGTTFGTGGVAWLPDPVIPGALMRSVTVPVKLSGLKPTLPLSGKFVTVDLELTPSTWGAAATVSVKTGTEKTSQAEAEAAPPATTTGKIKICDVVVHNTAGVYSIVAQRDRRPWASGLLASRSLASSFEATTATTVSELTIRAECTGVPVQAIISGSGLLIATSGTSQFAAELLKDGVGVPGASIFQVAAAGVYDAPIIVAPLMGVTAGSHLFTVRISNGGAAEKIFLLEGAQLMLRECIQGNANNGTS